MTVDEIFKEAHDTYKESEYNHEPITFEILDKFLERLHFLGCYDADEDMAECLHV